MILCFFFFKQKTAYEITASDWSSDVCSSDLEGDLGGANAQGTDVARAARDLEETGAAREESAAVAIGRAGGLGFPWQHRAGKHRRVERRAVALLGGLDKPIPADRRR